MKAYLYCTKAKPSLRLHDALGKDKIIANGFIVAACDVTSIRKTVVPYAEGTCLSEKEMLDYMGGKPVYLYDIKNVVPFKEPLKLSSFFYYDADAVRDPRPIDKAPQSWMYADVEIDEEGTLFSDAHGYPVLIISLKSKYASLIINGYKNVEVRKTAPRLTDAEVVE